MLAAFHPSNHNLHCRKASNSRFGYPARDRQIYHRARPCCPQRFKNRSSCQTGSAAPAWRLATSATQTHGYTDIRSPRFVAFLPIQVEQVYNGKARKHERSGMASHENRILSRQISAPVHLKLIGSASVPRTVKEKDHRRACGLLTIFMGTMILHLGSH